MTIVEDRPVITGGVDTHADLHVAAALDSIGGLLGVQEFPATAAGYASLLSWLRRFGTLAVAGVEGTGSYGAGLARHLAAAGVRVVEVDRPDRQDRARQGKSDPLDAVSAARVALRCSRRRPALAGRTGAGSRLAAHQDSRAATAPRLRFQVAGARCPQSCVQQPGQFLPADLGQRAAGAEPGEQPVQHAGVAAPGVRVGVPWRG